jgi:hypothetical protein
MASKYRIFRLEHDEINLQFHTPSPDKRSQLLFQPLVASADVLVLGGRNEKCEIRLTVFLWLIYCLE